GRTVRLALKLGKRVAHLRWLLDCELRAQVPTTVNHDPERIKQILGESVADRQQENSIRRNGDYWHLSYDGESGDYPHIQSLDWLHKLLAAPNKLIPVAELRVDPDSKIAASDRLSSPALADDLAIKAIKDRLEDIAEIENITGGSVSLETEKAHLQKNLQ